MPNLDEVLEWLHAHPGIGATFEAKAPGTGGPLARAIAAQPRSASGSSICSFAVAELAEAGAVDPAVPRMLIVDRDLPDADATPDELVGLGLAAGVDAINVAPRWVTAGPRRGGPRGRPRGERRDGQRRGGDPAPRRARGGLRRHGPAGPDRSRAAGSGGRAANEVY